MLIDDPPKHCPTCNETTPHSRRRFALPLVLSGLLLVLATLAAIRGGGFLVLAGLLAYASLFLFLREREQFWGTHCERCRIKQRNQLESEKLQLDGKTEIEIF